MDAFPMGAVPLSAASCPSTRPRSKEPGQHARCRQPRGITPTAQLCPWGEPALPGPRLPSCQHSPSFRSQPSRSGLKKVWVRSLPSSSGILKGSFLMLSYRFWYNDTWCQLCCAQEPCDGPAPQPGPSVSHPSPGAAPRVGPPHR